jgi:hypothetical protein
MGCRVLCSLGRFRHVDTTVGHPVPRVPLVLEVHSGRYLPPAVVVDPEAGLVTGKGRLELTGCACPRGESLDAG